MSLALLRTEQFARHIDRPEFNFFSVAVLVAAILSLTYSAQAN